MVQKGYKIYTLTSREFIVSRDAVFKRDVYPFKHTDLPISSLLPILEFSSYDISDNRVIMHLQYDTITTPTTISPEHNDIEHSTDASISVEILDAATDVHLNTPLVELVVDVSPSVLPPEAPEPSRKSQRVSKPPLWMKDYVVQYQGKSNCCYPLSNYVSYSNISSAYSFILSAYSTIIELKTYKESIQNPKWIAAMRTSGVVERYKTRLVAKGYSQQEGLDYIETFSLVAKMVTVRSVIVVVATKHWPIFQMDIKNAFLQGYLVKEVYMEIPKGFSTQGGSGKVRRLHKLYGLKQAPRQWNKKLTDALLQLGFT
ncbi:uncharacterized protein LOC142181906 [Nicotiana tabacum]|uniref:Uncharacterized protein LOC142181906 n=1 Tax=Nicotiana tabacum TaxID=4097 RepID=A0AC58UQB2_TOBAC